MEKRKTSFAVTLALSFLFTGACSLVDTSDISPEETAVRTAITSWPEKWMENGINLYQFSETVLGDIRRIHEVAKRTDYFNKFVDEVLASSFTVKPQFSMERWSPRPISLGPEWKEEALMVYLSWKHRSFVNIAKLFYTEQMNMGMSMDERMSLMFRFSDKMEEERKRLNALDVGDSVCLVDRLERDLWYYLKGDQTEEKKRVRARFERIVGHSVREPEQITADRREADRKIHEAAEKKFEAYKKAEYERLMRRRSMPR